ncbi:hypothetical protein [Micromonospora sp. CPCC 206061]|uniref:hypothetical protein n=1 Tax=Micromonospora sp. CPCC 206061 TaxID=3122410 RepID=UPI002FF30F24
MRVARGRLLWNLFGSLGILLTLGLIYAGLPALDRSLPADRPVSNARPYKVGGGVTVIPPSGAMIDVTQTRPGPRQGTVLFVLGNVRYVLVVTPFRGDLDAATDRLTRKIVRAGGQRVAGSERAVDTTAGLYGRQGDYTARDRGGRYTVFLVDGVSIEVTVSGSDTELSRVSAEIAASTRSIAYRGGGA